MPGVVGASGALISGPTTNEEMRNMAMKTPSAMPGAHQLENPEERCTTDTCHERGPNQWTDVVLRREEPNRRSRQGSR